jgi:hypothetical protein
VVKVDCRVEVDQLREGECLVSSDALSRLSSVRPVDTCFTIYIYLNLFTSLIDSLYRG